MTRAFIIAKVKTIIDNPELKAARNIEYKNRNYAQHKLVQQFFGLLNQLGDEVNEYGIEDDEFDMV